MDELIKQAQASAAEQTGTILPVRNRIAYVVAHGIHYSSSGYAIRTHGVAQALIEHGFEVICIVRPGRPWDVSPEAGDVSPQREADGVKYVYSSMDENEQNIGEEDKINLYALRMLELFRIYRPQAVLAASNWQVGLPAWIAAKRLALPFFNEVRGFWELSEAACDADYKNTAKFRDSIGLDTFVAKQAKKVFTLNAPMGRELVRRGVSIDNISITPTGVARRDGDPGRILRLRENLGLRSSDWVVGYIGSFSDYEDLESLIDAGEALVDEGAPLKLLMVGGDLSCANRRDRFVSNKTECGEGRPWLLNPGRVPHERIADYYSLLDLVVIPRIDSDVSRMVQPTKFAEAVQYNLPILMPEHCKHVVDDLLSNAYFYKGGQLKAAIKQVMPFTMCGRYKDDRSEVESVYFKVTPIVDAVRGYSNDWTDATNLIRAIGATSVPLDKEREVIRLAEAAHADGRISVALAVSKSLYEKTRSLRSLKVYVRSLFYAQKYHHLVLLCEGCSYQSSELNIYVRKSKAYLTLMEAYHRFCRSGGELQRLPPSSNRSVYFLHSSLPYFSGGYATRAHGLVTALLRRGLDVRPYTRPNFPYDVKKDIQEDPVTIEVDGVRYTKTACSSVRLRDEASYMLDCFHVFDEVIRREKPGYVHGRSTYQIALPALIAAKKNGVPFVYEVSGLWEVVHESRNSAAQRKHETERIRNFETMTALHADLVFTLTAAMKEELVSRGVDRSKIEILPNCVDPEKFRPKGKSREILGQLGISDDTVVIGYVGSFQDYEGLDDLIGACELVAQKLPKKQFKLLLVGDGPYYSQVKWLVEESRIRNDIIMTGRVSHSTASDYYSIIDIAPFPRKPWPVCEMVSPMKPLEAMAMGKAIIVSNVRALSEMVTANKTGLVFEKGDIGSLAERLCELISDADIRTRLGEGARDWVAENRSWDKVVEIFLRRTLRTQGG